MSTRRKGGEGGRSGSGRIRGIVIRSGPGTAPAAPRISAFIWGGKVRPAPTLPYGRWKSAR